MSWLYSIVFAGLLFSSNSDSGRKTCVHTGETNVPASVQTNETEKFEQTYPLNANGRVSVSNVNGSIIIEATERNEVRLEAVKIADSKEALAQVGIKVDAHADTFNVEADYDAWRNDRGGDKPWKNHNKLEVQFHLWVPRTAILDEIETVNGSVTVSNFVTRTKISAVNGNVNASNLRGAANLSTVNGKVVADFDRLETGSRINLSTVNGQVNLTIPSDANATIKADSLNGNITNDFGLPVRKGQYVGRDLYGKVGTGEIQIRLNSVNGDLAVGRKNDGKSTNPATNLLPQKNKADDSDSDDDDDSVTINTAKMDRAVARSVREASKTTEANVKMAQKELERLGPELGNMKIEGLDKIAAAVDTEAIQRSVKAGMDREREVLVRMRNADWSTAAPYIEKKSNTFAVKGVPKVSIDAKGCGVKVRGWDRPEVKYVVTELADRRNSHSPVSVSENATDSGVTLKIVNDTRADVGLPFVQEQDSVRIEVFVPSHSNLKVVTDGEIRLDGVSGDIELKGEDESINVRDGDGKLNLSSTDAEVRVIGFKGELDTISSDGDVYIEGNFSRINGQSGDGNFILTVPEGQNADVTANVDALSIEDLAEPKAVKEGQWRFGAGGPKYTFKVGDGEIKVRNSSSLVSPN